MATCDVCCPCFRGAGLGCSFYGADGWLGNREQPLFCRGCMARVPLTWGFPRACCDRASSVIAFVCFVLSFLVSVKPFPVLACVPRFSSDLTGFQEESRIQLRSFVSFVCLNCAKFSLAPLVPSSPNLVSLVVNNLFLGSGDVKSFWLPIQMGK